MCELHCFGVLILVGRGGLPLLVVGCWCLTIGVTVPEMAFATYFSCVGGRVHARWFLRGLETYSGIAFGLTALAM